MLDPVTSSYFRIGKVNSGYVSLGFVRPSYFMLVRVIPA
jgi:hypothetical protein